MGDELRIGRAHVKRRNPWGTWLLTLVTLGVYWFFWYYKVNEEARDYAEERVRVDPIMAVLAVTLGVFLLIPPFVSRYKTAQRVRDVQVAAGARDRVSPTVALLLGFIGFYQPYVQTQLNKAWDVEFAKREPVR